MRRQSRPRRGPTPFQDSRHGQYIYITLFGAPSNRFRRNRTRAIAPIPITASPAISSCRFHTARAHAAIKWPKNGAVLMMTFAAGACHWTFSIGTSRSLEPAPRKSSADTRHYEQFRSEHMMQADGLGKQSLSRRLLLRAIPPPTRAFDVSYTARRPMRAESGRGFTSGT